MKFSPSVIIDAPKYYQNHFDGRHDTNLCVVLRDLGLECDTEAMPAVLAKLIPSTHTLDLTNNELDRIPELRNHGSITTLLLGRNKVASVDGALLPFGLRRLVLANNGIESFQALDGLSKAPKTLENLNLRGNNVCHLEDYRLRVVGQMPQLKILDFTKVSDQERAASKKFKVTSGDDVPTLKSKPRDKAVEVMELVVGKMSEDVRNQLKAELANATTLAEIERIEKLLSGAV